MAEPKVLDGGYADRRMRDHEEPCAQRVTAENVQVELNIRSGGTKCLSALTPRGEVVAASVHRHV